MSILEQRVRSLARISQFVGAACLPVVVGGVLAAPVHLDVGQQVTFGFDIKELVPYEAVDVVITPIDFDFVSGDRGQADVRANMDGTGTHWAGCNLFRSPARPSCVFSFFTTSNMFYRSMLDGDFSVVGSNEAGQFKLDAYAIVHRFDGTTLRVEPNAVSEPSTMMLALTVMCGMPARRRFLTRQQRPRNDQQA